MPLHRIAEKAGRRSGNGQRALDISRFLTDAQNRAKRRKSPWNLVLFGLIFTIAPGLWWVFVCVAWYIHILIHPGHAGRWAEFWIEGIALLPFISSFLLIMPLGFPALTTAML